MRLTVSKENYARSFYDNLQLIDAPKTNSIKQSAHAGMILKTSSVQTNPMLLYFEMQATRLI
jgi:hypothetical protein